MSSIEDNAKRVIEACAEAAVRSGRAPEDVTLVAASKMNPAENVRRAAAAGIKVFGENRVQEMKEKLAAGAYEGSRLHLIGHLQTNKVKDVVGNCELIHSVDSEKLMGRLSDRALELGICQPILLEINVGGELSKSGIAPEQADELAAKAAEYPGIKVVGLMAIPPVEQNIAKTLHYFEIMRKLFIDMSGKKYDNTSIYVLSMGMSSDYREAILAGANMVRVGTAIFGARDYGAPRA